MFVIKSKLKDFARWQTAWTLVAINLLLTSRNNASGTMGIKKLGLGIRVIHVDRTLITSTANNGLTG